MVHSFDQIPCGMLSLDQDGKIRFINQRLLEWLGYSEKDELHGSSVNSILTGAGIIFYQMYFLPLIKLNKTAEEIYFSLKAQSGEKIPILMNGAGYDTYNGDFIIDCVLVKMTNRFQLEQELIAAKKAVEEANEQKDAAIAELKAMKQELLDTNRKLLVAATTDSLTGLRNRRSFEQSLESIVLKCAQSGSPLALLILDIDHFKNINDRWGHSTGDRALQLVAQSLQFCLENDECIFRIGGEEFAVILHEKRRKETRAVAESIRIHVSKIQFPEQQLTISIGIASLGASDTSVALFQRADKALYQSKEKGRNRVTFQV